MGGVDSFFYPSTPLPLYPLKILLQGDKKYYTIYGNNFFYLKCVETIQ